MQYVCIVILTMCALVCVQWLYADIYYEQTCVNEQCSTYIFFSFHLYFHLSLDHFFTYCWAAVISEFLQCSVSKVYFILSYLVTILKFWAFPTQNDQKY